MLRSFGHHVETLCDMLGVVGPNLNIFKLEPTTPNMSQHIAAWWPNACHMQRPAPPCVIRLRLLESGHQEENYPIKTENKQQ